uniref:Uncharacterized protein n=1 Tax=Romanomermis culicivorax TaxID=13658 RepID=A0A915HZY1_ROMCU
MVTVEDEFCELDQNQVHKKILIFNCNDQICEALYFIQLRTLRYSKGARDVVTTNEFMIFD